MNKQEIINHIDKYFKKRKQILIKPLVKVIENEIDFEIRIRFANDASIGRYDSTPPIFEAVEIRDFLTFDKILAETEQLDQMLSWALQRLFDSYK